jgi:hypothetical protein
MSQEGHCERIPLPSCDGVGMVLGGGGRAVSPNNTRTAVVRETQDAWKRLHITWCFVEELATYDRATYDCAKAAQVEERTQSAMPDKCCTIFTK